MSSEPATELGAFTAVIQSRMTESARLARAFGFAWWCGGLSVAAFLTAVGVLIAFAGYGHLISNTPAAEAIAHAIADSLAKTPIKTRVSGHMNLAPNSSVKLAPGQSVQLAPGSTVSLAPNSSVKVVGDVKMPRPSPLQLQEKLKVGDELPFTSYTLFRTVQMGAGRVETGWSFELSDPTTPKLQYCSYIRPVIKGAQLRDIIAVNGVPQRPSGPARPAFNFDQAVANCIWFSGL